MSQVLNQRNLGQPVLTPNPEFFKLRRMDAAKKAKGHLASIKRNEKCPCGSNVKFKKCYMAYLKRIAKV